jgi:hypothetical protein
MAGSAHETYAQPGGGLAGITGSVALVESTGPNGVIWTDGLGELVGETMGDTCAVGPTEGAFDPQAASHMAATTATPRHNGIAATAPFPGPVRPCGRVGLANGTAQRDGDR